MTNEFNFSEGVRGRISDLVTIELMKCRKCDNMALSVNNDRITAGCHGDWIAVHRFIGNRNYIIEKIRKD